jgi:hypothetical protein
MDWLPRRFCKPSSRRPPHTPLSGGEPLEARHLLAGDTLPGDPLLPDQWALDNTGQYSGVAGTDIRAAEAWGITTGSKEVVVAVIDSGVDINHPDLSANIWTNPGEIAGNGLDDDGNGFVDDVHGWDFVDNDNLPHDGYGHGTHIAGIIGAVANNGMGVAGIAWRVSIMPLRFQDNRGVGYTSTLLAALDYATMMRRDFGINIVVTNNSWEAGNFSLVMEAAIRRQGEAGITFVAAAGNNGRNTDLEPAYPGGYDLPNVIVVASHGSSGQLAGSSNYGTTSVDLAAPGLTIKSTLPGGGYGILSGTSMAAPQVTGAIALLAAAKPDITVAEVRAAILGSTAPTPGLVGKVATDGRLDAYAALLAIGATPTTLEPGPAPTPEPEPEPEPSPTPTPTPTPEAAPVTLPFEERFQQPDGAPDPQSWTQQEGRFVVRDQTAVSNDEGFSQLVLRSNATTDVRLRTFVDLRSGGSRAGLIARQSADGQTFYSAQMVTTLRGQQLVLYRHVNGVRTQLAATRVDVRVGRLELHVLGNQLSLLFRRQLVLRVNDATITAAGLVGLRAKGTAAKFANFFAEA